MDKQKLMSKSFGRLILLGSLIWLAAFFLSDCTGKEPIRVGFVAQLTGIQAELGVQERNGVQMAIEEINAAGGVAGRPLDLIIRDDLGTPEGAQAADRELIDMGVVAIIGHATTGQTMVALPIINEARVVLLSPTASAPELSGLDDYFFRVIVSNRVRAQSLAQHIYQGRHVTRIAVLYDTDNAAYSRSYLATFTDEYRSLGGEVVGEVEFSSKAQPDFAPLVSQLRASNPEGLLTIATDFDTALIAQRARLLGWQIPLFTSGWAQTEILISNGGEAVEGLEMEQAYPQDIQTPDFLGFKTRYQARFERVPSFGAALGYEAAKVLAVALQKTGGQAEGLKPALLEIQGFKGLIDTFSYDQCGDVVRPFYLGAIRDGKFVTVAVYPPTAP